MSPFQRFLIRYSSWGLGLLVLIWLIGIVGSAMAGWKLKSSWISLIIFSIIFMALISVWSRWMRERFVRESSLPQFIKRKLREEYPALSSKDAELVERGLRQFFLACIRSGSKPVAMPSVVVASAWRAFTDHPAVYEDWCQMTLGRAIPATSARRLGADIEHNDALRRTWYWACKEEAIKPNDPSRLPILFALDAKLAIAGGILYFANSFDFGRRPVDGGEAYFGTSFSDEQYGGSHSDFGGADGGSDGGGDGGGGD
jgi:hypothetical protein